MGDDRNTSQPSAAAALLTSGQDVQDHAWMLVDSRQSEVRRNIYLIKKYMRELYDRTEIDKSLGKLGNISKMEKSLAQLVDLTKSMLEQIRSLQPTVHKAVNPYPRFYEGEEYEIIHMKAAHIFNRSKLYILAQSGGYIIDTKTMSRCSSFPLPPSL
ncbi:PREDICTED: uncharacterized protein LOC107881573 [Prunus mume]|uniref:Uncharacterized protein LOC107881573 n=1 Tax=Prunus mume TaxID=102107 RepID=A0ABM1LUK4_PRUMU|nr:PREDICTED: uncharacterized protein LOC107881573 [Prunus mume]